jgi:O-antigen/teichoic acid export membrane protein
MSKQSPLARNIVYNFLAQIWFLILPLVVSPYLVGRLGLEKYGILALAGTVIGYLAVLDLGMGTATTKYLADHHAQRDFAAMSKVIGTSVVIYSGLGVVGTLAISLLARTLVTRLLQVPPELVPQTVTVFYISAIGFLINMPLTVFGAIPAALQRFDVLFFQNLVFGTANLLVQVLLLALGYSLRALVLGSVATSALGVAAFLIISRRLLPEVRFAPRFDLQTARKILRFSVLKMFSVLSGIVVFQLDRLLIAIFLPIASVSHYVIPLTLAQKIVSIIPNVTTAVFPAVSDYHARGHGLAELYARVTKLVALMVLPLSIVLLIFAEPILTVWMGADVAAHSTVTLRWLALAFLVASFAAVPGVFVEAMGRPGIPAAFAALSAVLNLSITLLLIRPLGVVAPAIALLVNGLITVPLFLGKVHRDVLHVSSWTVIKQSMLRPLLAAALLVGFYLAFLPMTHGLLRLGIVVCAGGVLFLLLCLGLGVVDREERKLIMELVRSRVLGGGSHAT